MTFRANENVSGVTRSVKSAAGLNVAIAEKGVIKIRGSVLATNYLNSPDLFQLQDGWFLTNDLGEIKDGRLRVLGRADDVIITGGENLSLTSIEATLSVRYPDLECAAFAISDRQWGQALHLAIVGEINETEISHYLEAALGDIAKPKGIHILESLPLLGIGKVDRAPHKRTNTKTKPQLLYKLPLILNIVVADLQFVKKLFLLKSMIKYCHQ